MTEWVSGWAQELSTPRTDGIALCPFAKKAWDSGEVRVVEDQDIWSAVHQEIDCFGTHRVVLCIQPDPEQDYVELETACMALNRWFAFEEKDIWLLSSQMNDSNIVFIQRHSELDTASRSLEKMGYYADYSEEDFERLIQQRRNLSGD